MAGFRREDPTSFAGEGLEDETIKNITGLSPTRKRPSIGFRPKNIQNIDPTGFGGDVGTFSTQKQKAGAQVGMKGFKTEYGRPTALQKLKNLQPGNRLDFNETGFPGGDPGAVFGEEETGFPGKKSTARIGGKKKREGGIVSFEEQKPRGAQQPTFASGLPTDRMPTFDELGGQIGSIFKYISGLSKFHKAKGLSPGVGITKVAPKVDSAFTRAKLTTLTKLHENALLLGGEEGKARAAEFEAQINDILQGGGGVSSGISPDELAQIEGL